MTFGLIDNVNAGKTPISDVLDANEMRMRMEGIQKQNIC